MPKVLTKSGTGVGALLVINATPATAAAPAAAPTAPPTVLTLSPTASPTGIAILQIKSHTIPSQKLSFATVTNTSSPSDVAGTVTNEFLPTVLDPGEYMATGIFLPSDPGYQAIQTAFLSGLPNQFQIQMKPIAGQTTTGNVYEFNAYVQEMPIPTDLSAEKDVEVKFSLKLTTVITVLVGS